MRTDREKQGFEIFKSQFSKNCPRGKMGWKSPTFVLLLASCLIPTIKAGPMKEMLDGMQQMMTGEPSFDQNTYDTMIGCFDPKLVDATNAQWAGFLQYANSGGSIDDVWPPCETDRWYENNCTTQEYGSVPIYEPCNYASNVAYYHTAIELCKRTDWTIPEADVTGMVRNFAILAQGSAFLHGSQTSVGGAADVRLNDLFTYIAYQAAVQNIESNNSIIFHLKNESRAMTALELTDRVMDMYMNEPVEVWGDILYELDFPPVRIGMCTFFATALQLTFEDDFIDELVIFLLNSFSGIDDEMKEFCLEAFIPEIRGAIGHIELPNEEKQRFLRILEATAAKLIFSFVWQEEVLFSGPQFVEPEFNQWGAEFIPIFNDMANTLHEYEYFNPDHQHGIGIYPGEKWCNPLIPHAKWHLETSIALTDFAFLADEMFQIFEKYA
eukprot:maker-scaffold10_size831480-snap-gene-4.12 protein:Tk01829 transcript:maker-scaffold10_size831480-snap-gene-4.12-mRNA-1 annotation:"hypothetical protein AURANDRAFT_63034"